MNGGASGGGDSTPRENGVTATSEVTPAARLPAGKQKSSKPTQPAAVASRPPTVPCGASKTLNHGPAKKPNVSQAKPLMPKNSGVSNTSGRVAVKKALGEKPSGVKASEKLAQSKEPQQRTAKWTSQPAVSAPKPTATKPRKPEQPKPTRTWLPGTKNATSSALSRAPVSDRGIGKPKQTAPPAGQDAAVQQPKSTQLTPRDPTRAATTPRAKPSSTIPTVKKLPGPKPLKLPNSKLQSEPSLGQKNVTASTNTRLLEKKVLEAPKPRTPLKTTAGSARPATPYRTPVPKVLAGGSSVVSKKLPKKDGLPSKEHVATLKKLQKATSEGNAETAAGEVENTLLEDTRPVQMEPPTEVEAETQLLLKEAESSRLEAPEAEPCIPTDMGGREDGAGCLGVVAPQVSTLVLEEAPLVFPSQQDVKSSPPSATPNLPVPEILELPEEALNLHTELLCQQPFAHSALGPPTPPSESMLPSGENTDSQPSKEQELPRLDTPGPHEQLDLLLGTAASCEDVCGLSTSSLDEDSQILAMEEAPVPSCVGGLPSPTSFVGLAEEVPPLKLPGRMAGTLEEPAFQAEQSPSASQLDSLLAITTEPQAAAERKGSSGFSELALGAAPPLSAGGERQREVSPVEVGDVKLRTSPLDSEAKFSPSHEGAQELVIPSQLEEPNREVALTEGKWVGALHIGDLPGTSQAVEDKSPLPLPAVRVPLLPVESIGDASVGHGDASGAAGEHPCLRGPGGDAGANACLGSPKQEDVPQGQDSDLLPCLSGEMSPGSAIGQVSMLKPQTLPLKSLELLQEPPAQPPEAPELLLSHTALKGHSPERGGSSSKSSTLSGPDLAGKSSSETSTPEELRDYDSSSGVESKSDERLEQTCHQMLSPLEDLPGELDLGIHMEKGDDEAETLPADEILGDPPTEPTVSSEEEEEEGELDADLLKDPGFTQTVCLSRSPPGKPSLPHSVEESDEPGSGDAGTETPASTNSAASCDVFGAFHLHSTDSCGKSPGLSSLESEEHSTEGSKEPLPKEPHSKTPVEWEHPALATPAFQKAPRGQDEESSPPFTAAHNVAAESRVLLVGNSMGPSELAAHARK
ncbi:proline-rich protein 36 isoform X2 [Paroedura picta]|uniref:proline-rich protein 36 isoform X2 n=1 Tax=Paroedura picta TaxID=143630 RepID=UPI004056A07F